LYTGETLCVSEGEGGDMLIAGTPTGRGHWRGSDKSLTGVGL